MRSSTAFRAVVLSLLLAAPLAPPAGAASLADSYVQRGVELLQQAKLEAAEVEFQRALALRGDLVQAHWCLFRIQLQRGDHFRAFDRLREVMALERTYRNADRAFQELVPTLPRHIRARLRREPRDPEAQQVLGFVLVHVGRVDEGVAKLQQSVALDPRRATAYDDLAWAFFKLKRFKNALEYSEKAFNLEAERPSVNAHYKKLFYLNKFGSDALRRDTVEDFYPPPRRPLEPAPSPSPTAAGPPPPTTQPADPFRNGQAIVDFAPVTVDDQALVDRLIAGLPATPASTAEGVGTTLPPDDLVALPPEPAATAPIHVPSPLALVKRLEERYAEGEAALAAREYRKAADAFAWVVGTQSDYRDVRRLSQRAGRLAEAKETLAKAQDLFAAGAFTQAYDNFARLAADRPSLKEAANLDGVDDALGECLFRQGRFREAVLPLSRWVSGHPGAARYRFMLARSYFAEDRFAEASAELAEAKSKDPRALDEFPDAGSFAIRLFIKANFLWMALGATLWFLLVAGYVVFKVRTRSSAQAFRDGFFTLARLLKDGDWRRVLEVCDGLEKLQPGPVERFRVDFNRAQALLGLGKLPEARALAERLRRDYPQDTLTRQLFARLLVAEGALGDEAAVEYRALLAAEPNNLACLEVLNQYHQTKDVADEGAERVLTTLRELKPDSTEYALQLCQLYLKAGRTDAAAERAHRAYLAVDGQNAVVREGLALCLAASEKWLEALKEANEVLRVEPLRRTAHELVVRCYQSLEMCDEAVRRYRALAEKYPGEALLRELRDRLQAERERVREQTRRERSSGEDLAAYYNRGAKLYAEGHFADALAPLQAAFRSDKFKLHAGALLVKIHARLKDPASAQRVFEQLDVVGAGLKDEFVLELCYEMAGIFAAEGKKPEAVKLYGHVCKADVNFKDAFKRLEDLQDELRLAEASRG